jgi:hypothetical protein
LEGYGISILEQIPIRDTAWVEAHGGQEGREDVS